MKRIIIPFAILLICSCSSDKKTSLPEERTPAVTDTTAAVMTPATPVDATTGATSKANQVSLNGTIVLPPQSAATVALTMGGIVKSTTLLPGTFIKQGTTLATLENPEFIDLQQNYIDSHAQMEYLEAEYQRQKNLSAEQAASQKKFQQSKADYLSMQSRMEGAAMRLSLLGIQAESLLKSGIQPLLQVKAPINGYVTDVRMNIGKYINAGDPLCEIVDKSRTLLRLTAYEKDLEDILPGATVQFRVNGLGSQTFNATVLSIGQKVDEVSRSLEVYARINDVNPLFRPGMYITARIKK